MLLPRTQSMYIVDGWKVTQTAFKVKMILTIIKAQDIEHLLRTSFFLALRANKCVSLLFVRLHWISFSVKIKKTMPTTIMRLLGFFNYIVKSLIPFYNLTVDIIIFRFYFIVWLSSSCLACSAAKLSAAPVPWLCNCLSASLSCLDLILP